MAPASRSGADVSPYVVEAESSLAAWTVEQPPASPIRWRETLGVYVGQWPRIFITSPEAFTGAIVEVCREPGIQTDHSLAVGDSAGIALRTNSSCQFLDLSGVAVLNNYWGVVRLTCRPPSQPDATPLTARFIRMPQLTLSYVPDPISTRSSACVSIQGDSQLLTNFINDSDTELLREPETIVPRARTPLILACRLRDTCWTSCGRPRPVRQHHSDWSQRTVGSSVGRNRRSPISIYRPLRRETTYASSCTRSRDFSKMIGFSAVWLAVTKLPRDGDRARSGVGVRR